MRLTNKQNISLENTIQGIKLAYPALKQVSGIFGFIDRNFNDEHIPLISGGGRRRRLRFPPTVIHH